MFFLCCFSTLEYTAATGFHWVEFFPSVKLELNWTVIRIRKCHQGICQNSGELSVPLEISRHLEASKPGKYLWFLLVEAAVDVLTIWQSLIPLTSQDLDKSWDTTAISELLAGLGYQAYLTELYSVCSAETCVHTEHSGKAKRQGRRVSASAVNHSGGKSLCWHLMEKKRSRQDVLKCNLMKSPLSSFANYSTPVITNLLKPQT